MAARAAPRKTLRWQAPELLDFDSPQQNNNASDMYTFALVLYEVWCSVIVDEISMFNLITDVFGTSTLRP